MANPREQCERAVKPVSLHKSSFLFQQHRCASVHGRDMRLRLAQLPLILLLLLSTHVLVAAEPAIANFNDRDILQAQYPDWFLGSLLDLQDDLETAVDEGKKGMVVVFGSKGCSYCAKFADEALKTPVIAEAMQRSFVSLYLDIFSDLEMTTPEGEELRVREFARQVGADFTPSVYFFDPTGRVVLRLLGYQSPARFALALSFVAEGHNADGSFREYLLVNAPVRAKALRVDDPLFESPPFDLVRQPIPAEQQLMVLFDGPECDECAYLIGTLFRDPRIRRQLEQLEVVRLRLDENVPVRRPGGRVSTAAEWHAELGLHRTPALVFFDEHGNRTMTSDALMLYGRLDNTLGFVLNRAYQEGMNYQTYARTAAIARAKARAEREQ